MKLSTNLLQAITMGIAVSTLTASCHQNEVNSGQTKQAKVKKGKEDKSMRGCPACGMG